MPELENKTAIVTGASRGIGRAISLKLSALGCKVVGVYKSSDLEAKQLEKKNPNIIMIKGDVGKEKNVKNIVDKTVQTFGSLDIVINNVGIDIPGCIENYSSRDWDRMFTVNLKSVFLFSKYSIPKLKQAADGMIINISSRIGFPEFTEPEFVVYGTVKAGVTSFTAGLAKELKGSVRVNAIIPTPTKTDLFDEIFTAEEEKILKQKGKLGMPEDVANLVVKLLLDKSTTGEILTDKRVYL